MAKVGRPTDWTPEKKETAINAILNRIAAGESVRQILRDHVNENLPSSKTFYEWLADENNPNKALLREQYARSCEQRADSLFDEVLEIADNANADVTMGDKGQVIVDGEAIARSRLRVDARKWAAGKLAPKKYGDSLNVAIPENTVFKVQIGE